jgi:hypothetical protein
LLEEEGGVGSVGLGEEAEGPFFLHGTGMRTTFAANDDPMDASEVEGAEVVGGIAAEGEEGGAGRILALRGMEGLGFIDKSLVSCVSVNRS